MPKLETTSTEDKTTETEALDDSSTEVVDDSKATDTTQKSDDDASADDKSEEDGSTETKSDETTQDDKTKADDGSTAKQDQNRLGYQIRQIRGGDPFVARAKKALQDDYVNADGISDEQREIRQMKSDRYIEKLETSRATLVSDNQKIAEEFSFFRPKNPDGSDNPEFNEALYKRATDRFARDSLEMSEPDEQGVQQIVGYKVRFLDYMREEADLYLAGRSQDTSKTPTPKKPAPNTDSKDDKSKGKGKSDAEMDAASEDVGGASTAKSDQAQDEDPMVNAFLKGFDSV